MAGELTLMRRSLLAASGLAPFAARATERDRTATFVLVHGAWHGGWCWRQVAVELSSRGHRVVVPTQTGLGDRKHLLSPAITLDTFVLDIVNAIEMEDLTDVVLVGHSFGGLPITGVADRICPRIRQLVYLDSLILQPGQSMLSTLAPDVAADRRRRYTQSDWTIPVPPPSFLGIPLGPDADWVAAHMTPHPAMTWDTPLVLANPVGNGLPCTYIACTEPLLASVLPAQNWARSQPDWQVLTIATGHDAMVTAPVELAGMLARFA